MRLISTWIQSWKSFDPIVKFILIACVLALLTWLASDDAEMMLHVN